MAIEKEIEFKQLLTNNQYYQLLHFFNLEATNAKIQVNHYFDDSKQTLKMNGCALRIRYLSNDTYEMTLKVPDHIGLNEYNSILDKSEAKAFIKHPFHLDNLTIEKVKTYIHNIESLKPIAIIKTNRIEIIYKGGLVCLDANDFDGVHDYELEYEVQDIIKGKEIFISLLKQFNIIYKPSDPKIKRAIEYKNRVI